jgi:hypothetical protein
MHGTGLKIGEILRTASTAVEVAATAAVTLPYFTNVHLYIFKIDIYILSKSLGMVNWSLENFGTRGVYLVHHVINVLDTS